MKKKYIIIALSNNDYHKNMLFEEEGWRRVPQESALYDNWYKVVSPQMFWRVLKNELKMEIEKDEFGFYKWDCSSNSKEEHYTKWLCIHKRKLSQGDGVYSSQVNGYLFKTIKEGDAFYELFE